MNKLSVMSLIAAASLAWAAPSFAADDAAAKALAQKNNCLACHDVDKKLVGPAYKEIAAKYKGDKTAEAKLTEKVKKGGVGVWGQIPMPPNPNVKDDEAKTLVQWVLAM
ncbi:MAG: c-type cytochrome [Burkholderiales bacterium]